MEDEAIQKMKDSIPDFKTPHNPNETGNTVFSTNLTPGQSALGATIKDQLDRIQNPGPMNDASDIWMSGLPPVKNYPAKDLMDAVGAEIDKQKSEARDALRREYMQLLKVGDPAKAARLIQVSDALGQSRDNIHADLAMVRAMK